jgi:hypothetical protein
MPKESDLTNELTEVRELLEMALEKINKIAQPKALPSRIDKVQEWAKHRIRLWAVIHALGDTATSDEVHYIWHDLMGQDPQVLDGLFSGKRASVTHKPNGNISLTRCAFAITKDITGESLDDLLPHFAEDITLAKAFKATHAEK